MSQLFEAQLGSASRKMLAVRLADFADDRGKGIWPTVARLSRETELSERQVQRILAEFVDEGLLIVRSKGGGKHGAGTRYDFDMAAIARLESPKEVPEPAPEQPSDGCHGVTRDTESPVTYETARGDSMSPQGCHHVTQTVIEPPVEPSSEREGAREPEGEDQPTETPQSIERAFWKLVQPWPNLKGMPKQKSLNAWRRLTAGERRAAVECFPRWLELLKANGKSHPAGPYSYITEKLWTDLPALEQAAKPTTAMAAPFGKLWMGTLLADLFLPPTGIIAPPTPLQRSMIASGQLTLEAVMAEKRLKGGWPGVNMMYERARERRGALCPLALEPAVSDFHQCHRDGDVLAAWRVEFARRGWPFYDGALPEWVWMPPLLQGVGDTLDWLVPQALEHFRNRISDHLSTRSRGNDDAA